MAKLLFDVNRQLDMPTLILEAKSGKRYGSLNGVTGFKYKNIFANPNDISFNAQKYIDGKINPLWDNISDLKTVYIPEYKEKFQIAVSYSDDELEEKSVTGLCLCASELGQVIIRDLEINTDAYFELNSDKVEIPVIEFYNIENKEISMLDKIVSTYCPHYTIKHVDSTLCDLRFEYSADEISVYDFLTGDVAEKMQCLFLFDSMTRSISVYDLCSTCLECFDEVIGIEPSKWKHYRDDFRDVCPNCGNRDVTKIIKGYGKDTAVLIDKENIANSIVRETDTDSIKNCFYVSGGDEEIDIAFELSNPNGSQYIYAFTDEMMKEMPSEFKVAWDNYSKIYNEYNTEHTFEIDSNLVSEYNKIVSIISNLSENEPYVKYKNHYSPTLKGMKSLTIALYNAIDVNSFIETSMQPTYQVVEYDKYETLALLNSANIGTIAVVGLNDSTKKEYIERSILMVAKTLVNTGMYDISIESGSYSNGKWTGVFSVRDRQNDDLETNTVTNINYETIAINEGRDLEKLPSISNSVAITINGDVETFCKNNIKKKTANSDIPTSYEFYNLPSGDKEKDDELETKLESMIPLYSVTCLGFINQTLLSCREVLEDEILNTQNDNTIKAQLEKYKEIYNNRMDKIAKEIELKNGYLNAISSYSDAIQSQIKKVHDELNIETYLKKYSTPTINLWEIFISYRREDTYKNENIISDNLDSNASIMQYADYLMKFAERELIKASTPQITVSGDLNNFLMFPEFEPILDSFETGNWIRVRTDINEEKEQDEIYKLRLLSYEVQFDDVTKINVDFSTVIQAWSILCDEQDSNKSLQTMATNFNSVKKDIEKSTNTTHIVKGWVNDGLDLTNQKIVSSAIDQGIVFDEHGILCRKYDDITESYDDCQLKIFNNGLYCTHNNWRDIVAGVGKFVWKNPLNNWQEEETYGIIARKIVGEMILGEEARFINSSGTMSFTESGLSVTSKNGLNVVNINPNENALEVLKGSEKQLYIDTNGNINLAGGAKISWTSLTDANGKTLTEITENTIRTTDVVAENLVVKAAKIEGTLTAEQIESGTIHAGSVDAEKIIGTTITGKTITGGIVTGNVINNGNGTFSVDVNGKLTATSGAIANWTITGNRIECDKTSEGGYRSGMQSLGSNGSAAFYAGTSTSAGGEINSQDVSAFFVTQDGRLYSNKATIKGTVVAESLKIKNKIYLYNDDDSKYMQFVNYDISGMITFGTSSQDNMYFEPGVQFNQGFLSHDDSEFVSNVEFHDNIYFAKNRYLADDEIPSQQYISTYWKDGGMHSLIVIDDDLLTSAVGWAGSSDYKTVLKLRSQVVEAPYVSGITFSSDERLKNSLKKLDEFDDVYMDLKPISFKYNNGASGRKHFGFGASQVRDSFLKHGFTTKDFGGFVQMTAKEGNEEYDGIIDPMGLIYTEFPAWNTHMIQKTIKELKETKQELANLQAKYDKLAGFVGYTE